MDKHELRQLGRRIVLELEPGQKLEISRKLSENLKVFLTSLNSKTDIITNNLLGGFLPLSDELDWQLLLKDTSWQPCIPSLDDNGSMEFYKISWKLLSKAFAQVKWAGKFPMVKPEVIIVPGLMFDKKGGRLGRGMGCFDKYLALNKALKIGVCSEEQITEKLTLESHDVLMDVVITDQNIYRRGL